MRITVGSLEEARRDPLAYMLKQQSEKKTGFTFGYQQALECVLLRFHKKALSAAEARQQLSDYCQRKFKNEREIGRTLAKFEQYLESYGTLGSVTAKTRYDIRLSLYPGPPESLEVTGRIPRLDITRDGDAAAWVFTKESRDWRSELRFPLIKLALARDLNRDLEEVLVGVYCFADGRHYDLPFTPEQVEMAVEEARAVFEKLA